MSTKTSTKKTSAPSQAVQPAAVPADQPASSAPSRIDQLAQLITRKGGATIAEMAEATGWQNHSIRGALAGALKKRGLVIVSEKIGGVRRYSTKVPA